MASKITPEGEGYKRIGVAVITGFQRTDTNTGRTVELFLCPSLTSGGSPDQSGGFFAERRGASVRCRYCATKHSLVEFFDAAARGLIVTSYTGENNLEGVSIDTYDMARAVQQAAKPGPQASVR
jgi:hypothetical protein